MGISVFCLPCRSFHRRWTAPAFGSLCEKLRQLGGRASALRPRNQWRLMARGNMRSTGSTVITSKAKEAPKIYNEVLRPNSYFDEVRQWLAGKVEAGTLPTYRFQKFFGVAEPKNTLAKAIFYTLSSIFFRMASVLGEEITFVVLLPFFWWHFPGDLTIRVVYVWSISVYLGHAFKDLFALPRPPAPVTPLEKFYAHEYGLPSTHAISATTFPLCVLLECLNHGCSAWVVVPFVSFWYLSVTTSRLYLGVHSPADLLAGTFLGVLVFWTSFPVTDFITGYLVLNPLTLLFTLPSVMALLIYVYPASKKWTNSYGDAATIIGVLNGGWLQLGLSGANNNYQLDINSLVDFGGAASSAWMRVFIGYVVVFFARLFMRKSTEFILVMMLPKSDEHPKKRYAVEIPSKFVTYSFVALAASLAAPMAMHSLVN